MECNCKWTEITIAVVLLIVTLWPNLLGMTSSWWITAIAAVVLLIHALACKNCCSMPMNKSMPMSSSKKKRR